MEPDLEEVAAAADEVADDQRRVAQRARQMLRQRERGWSWSAIVDREPEPRLTELLRRSNRRLAQAATGAARLLATQLAAEGWSRRQMAGLLGVSHQRITALLNHTRIEPAGYGE